MSNKLKDAEAKYNNDLWTLTDHVIMHLMGFNHTINPKDAFVVTLYLLNLEWVTNTEPL
jgi:ssRNA-specific RNase YbeY (16S rRNA maturation enzyme)